MSERALRLFIGAAISAECAEQLRETAGELAAKAAAAGLSPRWVAPANYHITVKYLGWVKPEAMFAVRDAVGEALAGARRFDLRAKGIGAFPELSRARVLWAGLDDQRPLEPLVSRIEDAVEPLGFERETRPFHAHITLARLKRPGDVSKLVPQSERVYSLTRCNVLNLYESVSKKTGVSYEIRSTWPLDNGRASER